MKKENEELEKVLQILDRHSRRLDKAEELDHRLQHISYMFERSRLADMLNTYTHPRRVFFMNVLVGIGRGLGLTIGTVIVLSLLGLLLRQFVDLPLIGDWISELLKYVEDPELRR